MRILSLRFRNLNSLRGEFQIDFDAFPFADAGLFAVTGPTGAGKSTIFDALTLALYGETPRLRKRRAGGEGIFEIVSRHTADAWTEVRFEVGAERYRARWEAHRARGELSGAFQPPKMVLMRESGAEEECIEDKLGEVPERVARITGLDFTRFTRSVLLAQGAFADFLQAPPAERAELLEKMTGTRIYSEISRLAFERAREEEAGLDRLKERIADIGVLGAEERSAAESALERTRESYRRSLAERDRLMALRERAARFESLAKEAETVDAQLAAHAAAGTGIDELRTRLERHEAVEPRRADFEQLERAEARLEAGGVRLEELDAEITALETTVENTSRREADLTAEESRLALERTEFARSASEVARLEALLEGLSEREERCRAERTRAESQTAATAQALRAAAAARTEAAASIEELRRIAEDPGRRFLADGIEALKLKVAELEELKDERESLEASLGELDALLAGDEGAGDRRVSGEASGIEERIGAVDTLLAGFPPPEEIESGLELAESGLRRFAPLVPAAGELQRLSGELEGRRREERDRTAELEAAQSRVEELTGALNEARRRRAETAIPELRRALGRGRPCPVCGSLEHPARLQTELFEEDSGDGDTDGVEGRYREALIAANGLEARLEAFRTRSGEIAAEIDGISARLKESGYTPQELERLEGRAAELRTALTERRALERERGELFERLARLRESRSDHDRELAAARERHSGIIRALEKNRERAALRRESIAEICSAAGIDPEGEAPAERAGAVAAEYRQALESLREAREAERSAAADEARLTADSATAAERLNAALEACAEADEEIARARKELVLRTGGRRPEELEADLTGREEANRKALSACRRELSAAREELAARIGSRESTLRSREEERTAIEELRGGLSEFALKAGFADSAACRAALLEEPRAVRDEIAAWERENARLSARREELTAELDQRDPDLPRREELEEAIAAAEAAFAAAEAQRSEAARLLESDDENRRARRTLEEQIEAQRREFAIWHRLRELIGSARGDSFRRFAQGLTLDFLMSLANRHLRRFSGRYRLKRVESEELTMQIIDTWQADTTRPVETLSGGETFLTSLSLALGLSELAGRKTRLDSLFLDEGFGTLDAETLETVLAALETLRSSGKLIGIISHVEELKDRVPVQIKVRRRGAGYSTIAVVPAPETGGNGGEA